jgi:hypothetical protein
VSRLSRKCGSLDVSHSLTRIPLPLPFSHSFRDSWSLCPSVFLNLHPIKMFRLISFNFMNAVMNIWVPQKMSVFLTVQITLASQEPVFFTESGLIFFHRRDFISFYTKKQNLSYISPFLHLFPLHTRSFMIHFRFSGIRTIATVCFTSALSMYKYGPFWVHAVCIKCKEPSSNIGVNCKYSPLLIYCI